MILKDPAWLSLTPGLPSLKVTEDVFSDKLQQVSGYKGKVYTLCFDKSPTNSYMIEGEHGQKLYLKIVSDLEMAQLNKTTNVTQWLLSANIFLPSIEKGFPKPFEKKQLIGYPYIEGRRIQNTEKDLTYLARDLALLHKRLKQYKDIDKLKIQTVKRLNALEEVRKNILTQKIKVDIKPEILFRLASCENLTFYHESEEIFPLHGDLNAGNVLYSEQLQKTIFLDFEDTLHSVLPVIYELAYILERFVLVVTPENNKAIELGRLFLRTYREFDGEYQFKERDIYSLQSLALRSLCVLILCEEEGLKVSSKEWKKFYYLEDQARMRQNVFFEILRS